MDLFPDEVARELEFLSALLESRRRQSLPDLLRAWHNYAERVASRAPIAQDDYAAMLFARDAIQDLLQRASLVTGRLLEVLINHDDSLFLFATRHDDSGSFQAADRGDRTGWWWDRVPEEFED